MTTDLRYGNVRITKIKAAYDELRAACRAEGTPRVQDAIDRYEQWADFAFMQQHVLENKKLQDFRLQVEELIANNKTMLANDILIALRNMKEKE